MTLITKPDMEFIWGSGGAIVEPSDVKKQTGWTPEVPPHQWENWVQNRQDKYLAHINQRGIPQWDGNTEYEASGLSYVQGSNGVVYKSVAASGPVTTAQDPTTDATDTYWSVAFASDTQATESVRGSVELATTAEAEAGTDDERAMTPLKVKQAIEGFASSSLPLGYFSGFTLSNNGGAPTTTVDTDPGTARSSDNTVDITLVSAISGVLQSSGAWAAGTGQNKLDTGAKANSTTYHVFAIRKTSDGTGDILFSLSPTAPTMPSGYAGFRRVGRIATDGSGNIRAFKDRGNGYFDWVAPMVDALVVSIASGSTNVILTGMDGAPVRARVQAFISADAGAIKLTATDVPNITTGAATGAWTGGHVAQAGGGSGNETGASEFEVSTDTSGQVIARYYSGTGNAGYKIITFGWQEIR